MKLSEYAEQDGVSYSTAYRNFKKGLIPGAYQLDSGTVIVPREKDEILIRGTQNQLKQIEEFCRDRGWQVDRPTIKCLQLGDRGNG